MSEAIIYVDHSEVREGRLQELKDAAKGLAEFVEANEPQILSYGVFFSEDQTRISIVHVHSDLASLEYHTKVGGPVFAPFADLIKMLSIDVYGHVTDNVLEQLRQKAQMLGNGIVNVHALHAGFERFRPD